MRQVDDEALPFHPSALAEDWGLQSYAWKYGHRQTESHGRFPCP